MSRLRAKLRSLKRKRNVTVNWGPVSEWVLVVLFALDSLAVYLFEHKKGK